MGRGLPRGAVISVFEGPNYWALGGRVAIVCVWDGFVSGGFWALLADVGWGWNADVGYMYVLFVHVRYC